MTTFSVGKRLDSNELWDLYQSGLSYEQLGCQFGVSSSTIKRRLRGIQENYIAPKLSGGVVHLDVTYWGRNKGLILAIDSQSGVALYYQWIGHERKQDYIDAINSIENNGYKIQALVLDGGVGLEISKQRHHVQMCQYHFIAIIRRKLTLRPKLQASVELLDLALSVTKTSKAKFSEGLIAWHNRWNDFLKEKTINPLTNRWQYTHRALRSAAQTFKEKLPFLFTFEDYPELCIPNTNNAIEGFFTALKSSLRNHNGMTLANKERLVCGFLRHRGYRPSLVDDLGE